MSERTPEQRHASALKAGATMRERKEHERERRQAEREDTEKALTVCRAIRDDEDAADTDRLEAIRLIEKITHEGRDER